jgi:cell division protein FtsB
VRRSPANQGPARSGSRPGRAAGPRGGPGRATARGATRATTETGVRPTEPISRSASRPAAARRPGPDGAVKRTRAPQPKRFTGRATVLGLILITLALAFAYPVRVYLAQESEIAELEAGQDAQRERIRELTEQLSKWDDNEYVIAQARRRLHYVRPGEIAYVIVERPPAKTATDQGRSVDTGPWYGKLWSNIQAADNPRPT